MNFFIESILYIIVILFPVLLNLFFTAYKENINKKESKAFLNISLLLSMYLGLYFFNYLDNTFIIFSTITIYLSFINKNSYVSFILLLIYFDSLNIIVDASISIYIINIILYLIIYYIYSLTDMSKKAFLLLFETITVIFFIVNFKAIITVQVIITYLISFYFAYLLVFKSKEVIKVFLTLKEVKKENFIKLSLFKITHEIKNPLAVIKGYLDMFNIDNKEKSVKYIGIIKNEVKRTLNLLSDLNDFNKISINKERIIFSELLDELKDILEPYFKENKIDYLIKTENDILINLDSQRIKQVLINVVKNAIEASEENGKINFTSYVNKDRLIIIVEDFGKGMEKETLDNLFTPFYTTKDYGTGLGLCLSKEIIEAHKGLINYTSFIGKGTTVKIVLPIN